MISVKEFLDVVSTAGALGFMAVALWAFATGRVVPTKDKDSVIEYERAQKAEALDVARRALESHDRLADAVEERNRLDRERLASGR